MTYVGDVEEKPEEDYKMIYCKLQNVEVVGVSDVILPSLALHAMEGLNLIMKRLDIVPIAQWFNGLINALNICQPKFTFLQ